jgi:hypothetical protein
VDAVGAPHVGERTEKQLITAFCDKIAELSPQLVTFNLTTPQVKRVSDAQLAPPSTAGLFLLVHLLSTEGLMQEGLEEVVGLAEGFDVSDAKLLYPVKHLLELPLCFYRR